MVTSFMRALGSAQKDLQMIMLVFIIGTVLAFPSPASLKTSDQHRPQARLFRGRLQRNRKAHF